jgi:hypothetical protein
MSSGFQVLSMSRSFGVIVEDQTDGDVIRVLARRVLGANVAIKVRPQKGCSKIKAKAQRVVADLLAQHEISDIIIVHDLDRDPNTKQLNDEISLRTLLSDCCVVDSRRVNRFICIPVEELEAWFWSDIQIVRHVGRGSGNAHLNPHTVVRPKEALQRLSRAANGKPRYSTQNNAELAEKLDLTVCAARCPSFSSLLSFLRNLGTGAR